MPDVTFAVPGDINSPTGGYIYDRRVIALLPSFGWRVRHVALPGDYPDPAPESLEQTERLLADHPDDDLLVIDGLAFGAMPPELVERLPPRIVGLVHHPLAREAGLGAARAAFLERNEREALDKTIHVLATSRSTAELLMREYDVPEAKVNVAEPGTEAAKRARGGDGAPRLLTVGSVTAHKGHRVLIDALSAIADLEWQSRMVGSLERDDETVAAVRAAADRPEMRGRIILRGALDQEALDDEYDRASLFVLPSYFEGYGMAFAEALARGLPVIGCAAGAVPRTVPADAGVLVPVGDGAKLAGALRRLLTQRDQLKRLSDAAWAHGQRLPTWRDTAAAFARGLDAARAKIS